MSKKHDSDMTQGVVWRQILNFAVPMMIGLVFQQLYNTVDTIVVGQFVGKEALAAVGSTGTIINMLVSLSSGLSAGAMVMISQHFGAHNDKRLSDAVQTTIVVTFLLSVIITFAGILLVKPMLRMMQTPDDVFDAAVEYLTIYYAGIIGLIFYNMTSGIMRAVGDSRRPLYFLIFSACTNIVLDLLFVVVFKLGVAGVAYATVLSQLLSAVLTLYVLTKTDAPYAIRWRKLRISYTEFKRILSIGLPTSIQQAVTSFSNVFVQAYINILGSACMAGWSTYGKLDAFVLVPMQAISLASSTFVGQNYGARQYERSRKGVNASLVLSEVITIALGLIVIFFSPQLMRMFTKDAEVIEFAVLFVRIITPFYVCNCVNQIYAGALRGIGDAIIPTVVMLASFVAFRQVFLFVNKSLFAGTETYLYGISLAYPSGWVMCTILMTIFYRKSILFKAKDGEDARALKDKLRLERKLQRSRKHKA